MHSFPEKRYEKTSEQRLRKILRQFAQSEFESLSLAVSFIGLFLVTLRAPHPGFLLLLEAFLGIPTVIGTCFWFRLYSIFSHDFFERATSYAGILDSVEKAMPVLWPLFCDLLFYEVPFDILLPSGVIAVLMWLYHYPW